jgi:hypothetical protein
MLTLGILLVSVVACSDDDDPVGPEASLVGTWQATSFNVTGLGDFIAAGMTLSTTFTNSGTFNFAVTGDLADLCGDQGPDCSAPGTYTATATQLTVTLDDDEEEDVTFGYSIQGSTMTWTGDIDGIPITVTFQKA